MRPSRSGSEASFFGSRSGLISKLGQYRPADATEAGFRDRILAHVKSEEQWWHRDTLPGHVTASAFLIDVRLERLLLHHHRKLDRWLQLGGHDEGEQDPSRAVLREVEEESGLREVVFFGGRAEIFDLDIHAIPARSSMPAHDHLDVRFLLIADPSEPLRRSDEESHALQWFELDEAAELMNEPGGFRVQRKLHDLREALRLGREPNY